MRNYGCRLSGLKSTTKWHLVFFFIILIVYSFTLQHKLQYPFHWKGPSENKIHFEENTKQYEKGNFVKLYNGSWDLNADFKCVKTRTVPRTTVCLYSEWRDKYISHDLQYTGKWEPKVADDFLEVLHRERDVGVLDLGANIGYYTLLAAKMGCQVVAVEPLLESIQRIHHAAQLEMLTKNIIILQNAIADVRIPATIRTSGDNQGDTRIQLDVQPCQGSCPPTVQTILLDDLVEVVPFTRAIIKMDIQGYEHKAFKHADILFSHINVSHVFMEWLVMKEFYVSSKHYSLDKTLVDELLDFMFRRNYRPYSLNVDGGHPLDPDFWHKWPDDVVWHLLPDFQVKSKLLRSHFYRWPP